MGFHMILGVQTDLLHFKETSHGWQYGLLPPGADALRAMAASAGTNGANSGAGDDHRRQTAHSRLPTSGTTTRPGRPEASCGIGRRRKGQKGNPEQARSAGPPPADAAPTRWQMRGGRSCKVALRRCAAGAPAKTLGTGFHGASSRFRHDEQSTRTVASS